MANDPKIYLGLDPGKKGGMACIYPDGSVVAHEIMLDTESDIVNTIRRWGVMSGGIAHAVIEEVSSSPQMGVTSAFTFGRGYGFLRGMLITEFIPFTSTRPRVWMQALGIRTKRKGKKVKGKKGLVGGETDSQWKDYLRGQAQQRFPSLELWKGTRNKGEQLAVCDALLIAEYCRITNRGE